MAFGISTLIGSAFGGVGAGVGYLYDKYMDAEESRFQKQEARLAEAERQREVQRDTESTRKRLVQERRGARRRRQGSLAAARRRRGASMSSGERGSMAGGPAPGMTGGGGVGYTGQTGGQKDRLGF